MIDLKTSYGKKVRVTREEPHEPNLLAYYQVVGKRGVIYAWDASSVEMLITNRRIAITVERSNRFEVKNHYDDGAAFLVPESRIYEAFNIIKARKRRQVTPEQREMLSLRLSKMRSSIKKSHKTGVLAIESIEKAKEATNDQTT